MILNKIYWEKHNKSFNILMTYETMNMIEKWKKIFDFYNVKWVSDLHNITSKTNLFSYYVLKLQLMFFYNKFLKFLNKPQSHCYNIVNLIINFFNKNDIVKIVTNLNCYNNNLNVNSCCLESFDDKFNMWIIGFNYDC